MSRRQEVATHHKLEVYHDKHPEKPKRKARWGLVLFGFLIIFVGVVLIGYMGGVKKAAQADLGCKTIDCFVSAAEECQTADINVQEDFGIIWYHTENCTLTKTIKEITDPDSQELKPALEGKSMTCSYIQDDLHKEWIESLTAGTELCEGELVIALTKLTLLL